jgi:hypothetical protein
MGYRALRDRLPRQFAACGAWAGLAYLTRPEGALIVACAGMVLLLLQAMPSRRTTWRKAAACGLALSIAALAVGGSFVAATGRITVKPTATKLLQPAWQEEPASLPNPSTSGRSTGFPLFAVWDSVAGPGPSRAFWSVKAVTLELVKGFYYVGWLPALVGLWWFRNQPGRQPGVWMIGLVCFVLLFFLWRVAKVMGYVSDRHLLLILVSGSYWVVAAILELPHRLTAKRLKLLHHRSVPLVVLLAVAGLGLAKNLEPLHANRCGFRAAGLWLAEHSTPLDVVKDPYCWSHYYAGRVFIEGQATAAPDGHLPVWYVIVEKGKSQHERLKEVDEVQILKDLGKPVWHWDGARGKEQAEVVIYQVPAEDALRTHLLPSQTP